MIIGVAFLVLFEILCHVFSDARLLITEVKSIAQFSQMNLEQKKILKEKLKEAIGGHYRKPLMEKSGLKNGTIERWFHTDVADPRIEVAILELIQEVEDRRSKLEQFIKST